ncbi:MAG: hypothetical protein MI923_30170, partial [Phycisphaerales bacterium]|nr:hypothetical protein [Phycisphaerales bacterium]
MFSSFSSFGPNLPLTWGSTRDPNQRKAFHGPAHRHHGGSGHPVPLAELGCHERGIEGAQLADEVFELFQPRHAPPHSSWEVEDGMIVSGAGGLGRADPAVGHAPAFVAAVGHVMPRHTKPDKDLTLLLTRMGLEFAKATTTNPARTDPRTKTPRSASNLPPPCGGDLFHRNSKNTDFAISKHLEP